MNNYPRIFALIETRTGSLYYTSTQLSECTKMYRSLPDALRTSFEVMRYDHCPLWENRADFKNK